MKGQSHKPIKKRQEVPNQVHQYLRSNAHYDVLLSKINATDALCWMLYDAVRLKCLFNDRFSLHA